MTSTTSYMRFSCVILSLGETVAVFGTTKIVLIAVAFFVLSSTVVRALFKILHFVAVLCALNVSAVILPLVTVRL